VSPAVADPHADGRVSARGDVPRLAERLRRRMSWSQLALAALSLLGLILGIGGLVQAVGLAPRGAPVRSLDAGTLALLAGALYAASGWGLAWALARGERSLAVRRLPLVLSGGVLIVAVAVAADHLLAPAGGGPGGSDGSGAGRYRRAAAARSLAAAVCDADLARAALGGALDGPRAHDNLMMRRSSMCSCSGPAGNVTLIVAPTDRAGGWADPTAAFPLALATDARWLVRVVAQPADGHDVDQAALQALADRALRSLPA